MPGLYVYGIVESDRPAELDGLAAGVGGVAAADVRWLSAPELAISAVVSPAPADLLGKRRDLLAHQRVLDVLVEHGAVLPMRFGVVTPDEQTLLAGLAAGQDRYRRLLRELAGRVELNLKAVPDEQQFIAAAADDRPVREALAAARRTSSAEGQLRLGQAVAAAVADRRQRCGAELLDRLRPLASRAEPLEAGERYVLNSAFLIERTDLGRFQHAVEELRDTLSPAVELVLTGPLPPYSFVES